MVSVGRDWTSKAWPRDICQLRVLRLRQKKNWTRRKSQGEISMQNMGHLRRRGGLRGPRNRGPPAQTCGDQQSWP